MTHSAKSSLASGTPDSPRRAFTLIELLIVISIIGILMAILFPAMKGALDAAAKTQARNDVTQIANAIAMYETEYGRFPTNSDTVSGELLNSLIGLNTNDNPRQIVFLEVQPAKKGKSGTNSVGYVDPWNQTNAYVVVMDTNYANTVKVSTNGQAAGSYEIRKKVAVWNLSPTNTRRQVRSWD